MEIATRNLEYSSNQKQNLPQTAEFMYLISSTQTTTKGQIA
jgi:hypothetical protein